MTTNDIINGALLSTGAFFTGLSPVLYTTEHNFWYAVVAAAVGLAIFVVRELLP